MKKLFLALFAAAAIVGCSKNDVIPSVAEDGATAGLKVAFKAMTKAEEAPKYANGTPDEQTVKTVTFYFFDENGGKFIVNGTDNYLSAPINNFSEEFNSTQDGTSIETLSDVMLVIKKADVSNFPTQMVAVINAPEAVKKSMTLDELKAVDFTSLTTDNSFIMTNSVYADGSKVISTTAITADNFFEAELNKGDKGYNAPGVYVDPKTFPDAEAKAVQIYVERVAAKVEVKVEETYYTNAEVELVGFDDNGNVTVTKTAVYAKVLGWGITNNTAMAKALKVIDPTWSTLGFTWNDVLNHRSHWATTTATPAHNLKFNDVIGHTEADYYFENTLPYKEKNVVTPRANNVPTPSVAGADYNQASLLLVAAQLVDAKGEALTISKWYSTYYAGEGAKVQMIGSVAHKLFVKKGEEYVSVTPDDVEWKQTAEDKADGRYKVYPVAKQNTAYYTTKVDGDKTTVDEDALEDANTILSTILPAQIWNTGYAYYYAPIKHYGKEHGIVRNHLYEVKVTALAGLGTPVYDPTHYITPEKPDEEEANLTAVININAWAVVSGDYEL